jgi:PRTRC genetic system protein B
MNENNNGKHRVYQTPAAAAEAEAALYFIGGQYLFHARSDQPETIKFLAPGLVRHAFTFQQIDSGWLSPETVRWGTCSRGSYVVNFYPPARRRLLIDEGDHSRSLSTLMVPLPGLVFAGLNQSWYIWAVRARRFAPDLKLFHAPLPNVDGTAEICFGENQYPEVGKHGVQAAWKLFISSPFNSHDANGKSHLYPDNVISQLSSLHERKAVRYPLRDLVGKNYTIDDEVSRLINR